MHFHQSSLFLIGTLVLFGVSCAPVMHVTTAVTPNTDFRRYHVFSVHQANSTGDASLDEQIRCGIETELLYKGWSEVETLEPDIMVIQHAATAAAHTYQALYEDSPWRWPSDLVTNTTTFQVGAIVVDIFDARTHAVIWRGATSSVTLGASAADASMRVNDALGKLFKHFPSV